MKKALTQQEALILRSLLVAHMEKYENLDLAEENETAEEIKESKQVHSEYLALLKGILAKLDDGGDLDRYLETILTEVKNHAW